ncbi:MAG: hypothetical protein AB8G15_05295 [Saprospiraceae bacterium]
MSKPTKITQKVLRPFKSGFGFILRVLLPFLLGMIANIIFAFIFLGGWLNGASWAGSIYAIVFFALFLVVFPVFYFWMARKYVMMRGLALLYDNTQGLIASVLGTVVQAVVSSKEGLSNSSAFAGKTLNGVSDYVKNSAVGSNRSLKAGLKFLLERAPIFASLSRISESMDLSVENIPAIQTEVQKDVDEFIQEELIGGSSMWLWLSLLSNLGLMYVAWQYFA